MAEAVNDEEKKSLEAIREIRCNMRAAVGRRRHGQLIARAFVGSSCEASCHTIIDPATILR